MAVPPVTYNSGSGWTEKELAHPTKQTLPTGHIAIHHNILNSGSGPQQIYHFLRDSLRFTTKLLTTAAVEMQRVET